MQSSSRSNFLTVAQLLVSGLGMALSLLAAAVLFLVGASALFSESLDRASTTALFAMAWISLMVAALAVPSLLFSIQRLGGWQFKAPEMKGPRLANILILLWPLVLVLGGMLTGRSNIAWLLLPPLQILAVGLPIWWLYEIARRHLPSGSLQRGWGIFNFSLFITTPVVIVIEVLFIGFLLVLAVAWIASQPELATEMERLVQRLMAIQATGQPDPEEILRIVRPYLQNPVAVFSIFALLSVLIPLLEELLKPLAMWTLAGRRLSPAEGFALGALCGASFALLESLLSLASPPTDNWIALVAGRAGTGLLHITTTAMVGWGLASAWNSGAYLRLGLIYLLAAAVHGLWNALSVVSGLGILLENPPESLLPLAGLVPAAPFAIAFLILLLFILLWSSNRRLRKKVPTNQLTPDPAVANTSQSS